MPTPRRLVIVGLGNYTHPLTRHSVGQVLLKNLASKAASIPDSTGSPHLELSKNSGGRGSKSLFFGGSNSSSWTTKITIPRPRSFTTGTTTTTTSGDVDDDKLEILFVLPRALMNVCGKTIVESTKDFLPPLSSPPSPSPTPSATPSPSPSRPTTPTTSIRTKGKTPQQKTPEPLKPILKLLVLSDDLDLSPSQTRVQRSGGPRGHNGVRSLVSALGSRKDFWKFWIGIGRPFGKERGEGVSKWVLEPLGREEVEKCEWDEEKGKGGEVLEKAWKEVLRIGFEEE